MSTIAQAKRVVPVKVGIFGEQGTGKTTTAELLALALSSQFHNKASIWVTDPELGWQFARNPIFRVEGVELVQRTVPTFKAMMEDLRAAEKSGASVYAVELARPWKDLLKTVQTKCGDRWGSELVRLWDEWVLAFLNSPLHCIVCARVSDITEDVLNEQGELRRVKTGEGMKAGGQRNNFGYEPHLLLRMNLERAPRKKKGKVFGDEGRMIHRADVFKDRTWALNGKVFRWRDKAGYKPGGFADVWKSLAPHFQAVQDSECVTLDAEASSEALIGEDGRGEYYRDQTIRSGLLDEFDSILELCFGGQTAQAKMYRNLTREQVTGFLSDTRMREELSTIALQKAVKVLSCLRKRTEAGELPQNQQQLQVLVELAKSDEEQGNRGPSLEEIILAKSTRKLVHGVKGPQPVVKALDGMAAGD